MLPKLRFIILVFVIIPSLDIVIMSIVNLSTEHPIAKTIMDAYDESPEVNQHYRKRFLDGDLSVEQTIIQDVKNLSYASNTGGRITNRDLQHIKNKTKNTYQRDEARLRLREKLRQRRGY